MPITLPTEIWIQTLSLIANDFNDRPKLWVSGRAVCTAFKEAIETIFREKHLPKTFIAFHALITPTSTPDGGNDDFTPGKVVLSANFDFSHLSSDKSTAFFVDSHIHAKFKPLVCSELRFVLSMNQFEKPPYTVQVRRELNDTPIPGLTINYDTMVLSCDRRGLYSAFFAEEHLVNKIRGREMQSFNAQRTALIDNVRGGQVDMIAAIERMLTQLGNANDEARKQARRVRIRREYEQWGYSGWEPREDQEDQEEEDRINKVLKERIFYASAESFSDEEGGDGDEDMEDDGGEWEDEEGEERGENDPDISATAETG